MTGTRIHDSQSPERPPVSPITPTAQFPERSPASPSIPSGSVQDSVTNTGDMDEEYHKSFESFIDTSGLQSSNGYKGAPQPPRLLSRMMSIDTPGYNPPVMKPWNNPHLYQAGRGPLTFMGTVDSRNDEDFKAFKQSRYKNPDRQFVANKQASGSGSKDGKKDFVVWRCPACRTINSDLTPDFCPRCDYKPSA